VHSPSRTGNALRAALAEHFELMLTTCGVLIAIAVTFAQLSQGVQGLALTYLIWLQGFILWAVHRYSLLGRKRLIRKLRLMLQDKVNNQLTVLVGVAELSGREHAANDERDLEVAVTAAKTVSRELDGLSMESLRRWERQYSKFLPLALH
jgi:hypothetical protein